MNKCSLKKNNKKMRLYGGIIVTICLSNYGTYVFLYYYLKLVHKMFLDFFHGICFLWNLRDTFYRPSYCVCAKRYVCDFFPEDEIQAGFFRPGPDALH
jgi:hypothetical protein